MLEDKPRSVVEFKGTKKGMLIILDGNYPLKYSLQVMIEKLKNSGSFFKEAPVRVQVKHKKLNLTDLEMIKKAFSRESQLDLVEIISKSGEVLVSYPSEFSSLLNNSDGYDYRIENSIVIHRTLRSGQKVVFPGSIVVIGNINPGAELVARGDIIVFGSLKGTCHAGSNGDKGAAIIALKLQASQLRIANLISRAPDNNTESPGQPEKAFINGNQIVVEPIDLSKIDLSK